MKVLILSEANSIHTKRWIEALIQRGVDIMLVSLSRPKNSFYEDMGVRCVFIDNAKYGTFTISKLGYLKLINPMKKAIRDFSPDILHAHFASSYGLIGTIAGFHPYIVSVWGSDIYEFPKLNPINRCIIKYVLRKADLLLSTSHVMAKETHKYTNKKIYITPFGVDIKHFKKIKTDAPNNKFIIGNVKTLAPKYGIDVLIKAFKLVLERNEELDAELHIYGTGPSRLEYTHLVEYLGISDKVKFMGWVENKQLPKIYSSFSVSVSVSNSESFGVVAVEAMACECPVVTSDAEGFTEVVDNGVTGFIVPKRDAEATARAIQKFIDNPELRERMGKEGRNRVLRLYDWEKNVDTMFIILSDLTKLS